MNTPPPPQYVTSLEEVLWGGTLVAITMVIHGFGMLLVLQTNGVLKERFAGAPSFAKGMLLLILASWMILLVHLVEVFAWAGFFVWKDAVNTSTSAPANASLCYYFALMDYTTLGSNYNLHLRWRLLEGMIAVAGLLTFAWSTGVLLTLAQEFQDQEMSLLNRGRKRKGLVPAPAQPSAPPEAHQPSGDRPAGRL